jgi:putative transposase
MASKLIRIYGRGHLHFITFSCYRRVPFLRSVRSRNVFVQILGQVRDRYEFSLVGYVVMPEHVHLLIGEPAKGTPSTVIQVLKQRVSRRLRRKKRAIAGQLNLNFASGGPAQPRMWQRRFYDFNEWSLKKRVEKLHYMHMNPLKRKLVDHPKDWPWSSFSFYANPKHGLIRVDPVHGVGPTQKSQNPDPLKARGSATRKFKTDPKAGPPATRPKIQNRPKGCATRPVYTTRRC